MKPIIRQGDTLREHGGTVIGGHYLCFGKGIACKGDQVSCNEHGLTVIAEGSSLYEVDVLRWLLTGIIAPAAVRW